MKYIVLNI